MQKNIILIIFLTINLSGLSNSIDSSKVVIESLLKQKPSIKRDSIITGNYRIILSLVAVSEQEERKKWCDIFTNFSKKSTFDDSKNQALLSISLYHLRNGLDKLAFTELETVVENFKKTGNNKDQLVALNNITLLILHDLSIDAEIDTLTKNKLFKYLNYNLELTKKSKLKRLISNSEAALGLYYLNLKNYEKARIHYRNGAEAVKDSSEKYFYSYYNGVWAEGLSLLFLDRTKEGFEKVNFVRKICEIERKDGNEKMLKVVIGCFLGKYYNSLKEYKKALIELEQGQIFLNTIKLSLFEILYSQAYYEAYKNSGNNKLALFHLEKLQTINKQREKTNFNQLYSEWQTKYETEKQSAAIKTLEIKQLKSESEKNNLIRNVLLMSLLAGICLVFYVYKNNLNLQTKNTELEAKNKEIKGALLKGQTIERKRVAEELHDNLSAKIAAVRWRMESLDPTFDNERDTDFYHKTSLALGEIYTDVRLIAHNLLPAVLEQKGLIVAIKNLVSEINGLNKTQFTANVPDQEPRFANKIEYELYSILLELSNNILKHSKAEHANVTLKSSHNLLQLIVADDGIGINNAGQTSGMGFGNLKSRVESINGILKISSENGLEIMINVPV